MRVIESEVPPGKILFRQWLAVVGAALGLVGAGATLGSIARRAANGAAVTLTTTGPAWCTISPYYGFDCGGGEAVEELDAPALYAILPPGRRRDPAL